MPNKIRKHLTYANVAATMALVFALTGGAVAATSHGGGGSGAPAKATASVRPVATVAKAKSKAKSGPRGPKGAAGPTGQAGKNGANGATGPAGAPGAKGENGAAGGPGSNGTGVTSTAFSGEKGSCLEGGTELVSASGTTYLCNGVAGAKGHNGTTGFTKTLPEGETETGAWSFATTGNSSQRTLASISFPIPLGSPLSAAGCQEESKVPCQAHYINRNGEEIGGAEIEEQSKNPYCKGSVTDPTAEPGNFCVYEGLLFSLNGEAKATQETIEKPIDGFFGEKSNRGAGANGAVLLFHIGGEPSKEEVEEGVKPEVNEGNGSWAVTAE